MTTDYVRQVIVSGVVKNIGSETASAAIRIEFHRDNIEEPMIQTYNVKDIPPGGNRAFQIMFGVTGIYTGWYSLSFE